MFAESKMPIKYVSSGYKKGDEDGFGSRSSFRDGDGYDIFESHGDRDKDNYGFVSEEGFGKRTEGQSGQKPKTKKHSFKKTSKNGSWETKDKGSFEAGDYGDSSSEEKHKKPKKNTNYRKKTIRKPM